MALRLIARDLYRLQQEVERLEKEIESAAPEQKDQWRERLRRVRAERDRLRGMLEANKEPPPYRKPR
jgi:hypothetical protein